MPVVTEDFTIGVEEEYQIVNPETRELRPRASRLVLQGAGGPGRRGDERVLPVADRDRHARLPHARRGPRRAVRLRRGVVAAAERDGSRIAAAGTHPFSHWEGQPITPKPRYLELRDDFQQLAREQIIFGCHVHVGIADRDEAIQVMNRCPPLARPDHRPVGQLALLARGRDGLCLVPDPALLAVADDRDAAGLRLARRVRRAGGVAGRRRHDPRRLEDLLGRPPLLARRDARVPRGRRLPDHRRGGDGRRALPGPGPDLPRASTAGACPSPRLARSCSAPPAGGPRGSGSTAS